VVSIDFTGGPNATDVPRGRSSIAVLSLPSRMGALMASGLASNSDSHHAPVVGRDLGGRAHSRAAVLALPIASGAECGGAMGSDVGPAGLPETDREPFRTTLDGPRKVPSFPGLLESLVGRPATRIATPSARQCPRFMYRACVVAALLTGCLSSMPPPPDHSAVVRPCACAQPVPPQEPSPTSTPPAQGRGSGANAS
ncbi:MAG: hypothetical protein H6Q90_2025, partial [Deltaproteobacteria bacterium]|nr:hypothetical protein [Deltaproteobacteria bacterium]